MYSRPDAKNNARGEEIVICLDPKTGEKRWERSYPVERLKGQESYTGEPIRPQATPAVCGTAICTLGYTGILLCSATETGKELWKYDLVKEFDATPVQFGFASSPLVLGDRFIVHVGGKQAAVIAIRATDGQVLWKSTPAEPSYSSPMRATINGTSQIVQMTRDHVFGLSESDGKMLWSYTLPKPGLTNVPTPIVLPGNKLLISGQGTGGTRLLELVQTNGTTIRELWKNEKVAFFYANWISDDLAVYGSVGPLFGSLSLTDGKELWRDNGQQNANLIVNGRTAYILRGDGRLSRATFNTKELDVEDTYDLLKGRSWTAPTIIDNVLYARSEKEITAVQIKK